MRVVGHSSPFMRRDSRCEIRFSGVVGRRYSVSVCPLSRPSTCADPGAQNCEWNCKAGRCKQDGQLIPHLYPLSSFSPMRYLPSTTSGWLSSTFVPLFFMSWLYRLGDVYDRLPVLRRSGSKENLEIWRFGVLGRSVPIICCTWLHGLTTFLVCELYSY